MNEAKSTRIVHEPTGIVITNIVTRVDMDKFIESKKRAGYENHCHYYNDGMITVNLIHKEKGKKYTGVFYPATETKLVNQKS